MRSDKSILGAFILNLAFAVFEFFGGIFTGSVAIISDAVHDLGDASSLGLSYFLERKSKRDPDCKYTYGYGRYSVLGALITTLILLLGSFAVIANSIKRIVSPIAVNYDGMILFAIVGVIVNSFAAYFTGHGGSANRKAVNLHMLEDVLGWIVVLIGAVVMRFTEIAVIDPLMSIGVALFISINAIKNLTEALSILLEKAPCGIGQEIIKNHIMDIDGIESVHHIHTWTIDGENHFATMHIVTAEAAPMIKEKVRKKMHSLGISHVTVETELPGEVCHEMHCNPSHSHKGHSHHHHH